MSKVYQISVSEVTVKGKHREVVKLFVNTVAEREAVQTYYYNKFKPLNVVASEVETLELDGEKKEQYIEELSSGGLYSTPSYRISREVLPENVNKAVDELDAAKKDLELKQRRVSKLMGYYFDGAYYSSHDKEEVKVTGYLKALKLQQFEEKKDNA